MDDNCDDNQKCNSCKRRRRIDEYNNKKTKKYNSSSNEQRLVVMSYSRYCRYRAQLQRKREEQVKEIDPTVAEGDDNRTAVTPKNQGVDKINTTRVLFCRDTYDYPAELLLEPFNAQHGQQQNTSVLVNHMGMFITIYIYYFLNLPLTISYIFDHLLLIWSLCSFHKCLKSE